MKVDFYRLLQVEEDAGEDEIRRAYRRLAKTWHPDKNPSNGAHAANMFQQINEAYQVLLDPNKRAAHDRERRVEKEASPRSGEERDEEILMRGSARARFGQRLFRRIFGDDIEFANFRKAEPIETTLPCSLEELCNGVTKKMKISRKIVDASGKKLPVEDILRMEIKPGCEKGKRFIFEEMGNEELHVIPGDLIFIVDEKPHSIFTREGNDLIMTKKITLVEALAGVTFFVETLDGRKLKVVLEHVIHPGYEKIVFGEGMPVASKGSYHRGNLRIRFVTEFPEKLTAAQKVAVRRLFAG